MSESNIKRVNIRMGQDLHEWFEQKADELGVPTSALMIVAMNEYRKAETSVKHLPMFHDVFSMMQSESVQSRESVAVLDVEKT